MRGNPSTLMVMVSIIGIVPTEIVNDSIGIAAVNAYFSCLHQVSRRKKPATKAARLVASRLTKAQV